MPRGRPKTLREDYTRIKLQKDTHRSWAKRKVLLQLKSDDELARFLLGRVEVPAPFNSDEYLQDTEPFSSNSQGRASLNIQLFINCITRAGMDTELPEQGRRILVENRAFSTPVRYCMKKVNDYKLKMVYRSQEFLPMYQSTPSRADHSSICRYIIFTS